MVLCSFCADNGTDAGSGGDERVSVAPAVLSALESCAGSTEGDVRAGYGGGGGTPAAVCGVQRALVACAVRYADDGESRSCGSRRGVAFAREAREEEAKKFMTNYIDDFSSISQLFRCSVVALCLVLSVIIAYPSFSCT